LAHVDAIKYGPPDDAQFHMLVPKALRGEVPVYGVVLNVEQIVLKRAFDSFRPENMPGGDEIVRSMMRAWQLGQPAQPWLYVRDNAYIVADDYFWMAMVERGRPITIAAQVIGEPHEDGLIQKVGPLSVADVKALFGFSIEKPQTKEPSIQQTSGFRLPAWLKRLLSLR
jgi:hypothetical protein